ncbi:MAG TPA: dTDP-4-dehydrorhamnose reductase [Candidatus Dormibacteraeota bacterium]|nr:dTDP-4-dehydrorhamnose reductase [Candidatus Dormibacteraeota bacterium]
MKALVFGAEGQLGIEIVRLVGEQAALAHRQVSITDAAAVDRVIAERKPDIVFNCAAYNAVDRAESEPEAAHAVNTDGPRHIAVACARHGARFVHFSTNFVFDGDLDRPYIESDRPSPLSTYARSKLGGETGVLTALPDALVMRTAAVYGGRRGQSFPERILQRARSGEALRVVSDQRVNPTYAADLAAAAVELAGQQERGIVHAVAGGCTGWDDFARATLEEFELEIAVESVPTEAYPTPARRPMNGCMESIRYRPLRPWREALHDWATRVKQPKTP